MWGLALGVVVAILILLAVVSLINQLEPETAGPGFVEVWDLHT